MNKSHKQKISLSKNRLYLDKLNNELSNIKETELFCVSYYKNELLLSNGRKIEGNRDIKRFINRIRNAKFYQFIDELYQIDTISAQNCELKLSSFMSSLGGKQCQQLHGNKIKNNLTGWVKGKARIKGTPCTEENKRKLSESRKGKGNPMWGTIYSEEYKKNHSNIMKGKILNGDFTPKTNNRFTHYDIFYKGKNFRSSWEVVFYHFNSSFLYESLRIPYFDTKTNKERIYIVDFISHDEKIVVEIKPKELIKETEICKLKALYYWSKENGYKMEILTQNKIKKLAQSITDFSEFEEKTKHKILKI